MWGVRMKLIPGANETPVVSAYRSNVGSLRNFLRRFFECTEDIEDLLQETFIKTFEAEHSTSINVPQAFLFKTAKNLAINELSRRARHKSQAVADIDSLTVLVAEREEHDGDPAAKAAISERLARASKAVDRLSPRVREVFLLRHVEGLKQREIARRLGIAESTVEKHIARGLAQIALSKLNQGLPK